MMYSGSEFQMEEAAAGNASAVDSGEFDRRLDEMKNRFGVG